MPRNKGIGRKYKPKRDASAPDLRPKEKKKLETTGRAEEPCNVDSDDEEFSDCDDGFGAVINDEMRRGASVHPPLKTRRPWLRKEVQSAHASRADERVSPTAGSRPRS